MSRSKIKKYLAQIKSPFGVRSNLQTDICIFVSQAPSRKAGHTIPHPSLVNTRTKDSQPPSKDAKSEPGLLKARVPNPAVSLSTTSIGQATSHPETWPNWSKHGLGMRAGECGLSVG